MGNCPRSSYWVYTSEDKSVHKILVLICGDIIKILKTYQGQLPPHLRVVRVLQLVSELTLDFSQACVS
jgi:hypothetical protein